MKILRFAPPLFIMLILSGCGNDSKQPTMSAPEPSVQSLTPDLEATMTAQLDRISGVGSLSDERTQPVFDTNFDYYAIVFVWGTLRPVQILGGPIIDWSGNMNFNGVGDIAPVHPIDFEPETDAIVPDTFTGYVEWNSSTLLEFDGIAGIVTHDRRVVYITSPRLQFVTTPFTIELRLDELDHFCKVFPVDSTNAVAVMAHRIRQNVCAHGEFKGLWIPNVNTRTVGTLHGLWFNADGDSVGRYNGKFWIEENGDRLFEGTISGLVTDDIKGHFRGTWWFDDPRMCPAPECGTGHGRFVGKLAYLNSGKIGEIDGEFGDFMSNVAMPMHGRWRVFCPNPNLAIPEPNAD